MMLNCGATIEALREFGTNICPVCNNHIVVHVSKENQIEIRKAEAEIRKEEIKAEAEIKKAEIRKEEIKAEAGIKKAEAEIRKAEAEAEIRKEEIKAEAEIRKEEIKAEAKEKTTIEDCMEDLAKIIIKGIKSETFIKKQASQLSTQWYDHFLCFSTIDFPSIEESEEFQQFINDFNDTFDSFLNELEGAHDKSEKYVQASLGLLMNKIFELFFKNIHNCEVNLNSRVLITMFEDIEDNDTLKLCRVSGTPDGSILWRSIGIHVWEVKNQNCHLDKQSPELPQGCAQIAIYMKYDIEKMWRDHSIITDKSMGILTNGSSWVLIIASVNIVDSKVVIRWRNSETVYYNWRSNRNLPERRKVLYMIYLACLQSQLNLDFLVKSNTNTGSYTKVSSSGQIRQSKQENHHSNHDNHDKEQGNKQEKGGNLSGGKASGRQRQQSLKTLSLTLDNIQALKSFSTSDYERSQQLPQWFEKMLGKPNRQVITMTTEDMFENF